MNGLQLKGAEEEVEPVHGETETLRDRHSEPEKSKHSNSEQRFLRCSCYFRPAHAEDTQ